MAPHGHARSDARNLHLHRVAFEHLRASPELRLKCRDLLERWLASPDTAPSSPWLLQWREMLADWPIERIAETVLDPETGQTLRQCSPLGPALTPRERWAALRDAEQELQRTGT
jgi:hypothetical protein